MKMKKILKISVFTVLCILILFINVSANDAKVTVDGESIKLDQPPIIRDGRVLLPLRAVGEALLCKVDWEHETYTAILNSGYAEIRVKIGEYSLEKTIISGDPIVQNIELDVPAIIENGRTMVPLRTIAESLYLDVNWDEENRTAVINRKYDNIGIATNGYIRVDISDKMGFMDLDGNIVIPVEYENDTAYGYVQGNGTYAIVKKDGKYGAVDMNNKTLVNFSYTLENIDALRTKAETGIKKMK